jgi:hypothetical protein
MKDLSIFIGWKRAIGAIRSDFWVRRTVAETACYQWLHPVTRLWVDEPDQISMPCFATYEEAYSAALENERLVVEAKP